MAGKRSTDPGQTIADKVRAGEIDADEALQMVAGVVTDAIDTNPAHPEGIPLSDDPSEEDTALTEEQAAREEEARRTRINAMGHRLQTLAKDQINLRQQTEERWYQDVRQFNGQYDPDTFPTDESGEQVYGSRLFVPLTRRLCGIVESRLFDQLFQAGERNFVLKPTPVPDLDEAQQLADKMKPDSQVQLPGGQRVPVSDVAAAVRELVDKAQRAADAMQREIDDQLAECKYPIHARNAIHDAVLLGTGILKGPTILYRTAKRWVYDPGTNTYTLKMDRRPVPVTVRVDPWNFFPDMSATTIEEAEFVFERHFMTKKELSALKDLEAVDLESLRRILGTEPTAAANSYRERLRAINGASGAPDKRYEVWEYHGPLTVEDLEDCGVDMEGCDPLTQYTGIVWFCEGVVIKAALNPLDSGEHPYRVFVWQKDESNIFGFGLPYEVRDNQVAANSSFRAILDNLGLAVGPQFLLDDTKVEPMNGRWDLEPKKGWRNKNGLPAKEALQFIDIPVRVDDFLKFFQLTKGLVDEIATLPAWMQGQDAPSMMNSAMGASISWTAANLWVRRCIRNWDDDIVTPMITGFFDWNMQYNPKKEIKGDSKVVALGIAALAELEGHAQRMQQFMNAAKQAGVPLSNQLMMLRQFARAFKLDPDLVLPTEAEIEKIHEQEAKNPPVNLDQKKLEVQQENNRFDDKASQRASETKAMEIKDKERDRQFELAKTLATIASNERISTQEAAAKYGLEHWQTKVEMADRAAQRAHDAQTTNVEAQLRVQTGAGV